MANLISKLSHLTTLQLVLLGFYMGWGVGIALSYVY